MVIFFKKETAYEYGTGDGSSDVCASKLSNSRNCTQCDTLSVYYKVHNETHSLSTIIYTQKKTQPHKIAGECCHQCHSPYPVCVSEEEGSNQITVQFLLLE